MKIKEVIEKTELTDRAIRLYMENGLINPYCKEAYNGRKNIEFSEQDVEELKNIALLRKAGFSIAEIKELQYGGESAKYTFKEFLNKTQRNIEQSSKVFQTLKVLEEAEEISVKNICDKLSAAVADQNLPIEDLKPSLKEGVGKAILIIVGIIGTILAVSFLFISISYYKTEFNFIELYEFNFPADLKVLPFRLLFVIQLVLSIILLLLCKTPKKIVQKKGKKRKIAIVIVLLWGLSWFAFPMKTLFVFLAPPVYSQTENPQNYLIADEYVRMYGDDIYKLFPVNIPRSAISEDSSWYPPDKFPETTKYYYKYENMIDPSFDIVAEWKLPEEEYQTTKEEILKKDGITAQKQKGDWQCIYFADCEDDTIKYDFYFLVFAYNDRTNTVRYIASYCMDAADGAYTPYYFELEW